MWYSSGVRLRAPFGMQLLDPGQQQERPPGHRGARGIERRVRVAQAAQHQSSSGEVVVVGTDGRRDDGVEADRARRA